MTEIGEQPKENKIPEVNRFFLRTLNEDVEPKPKYLQPWFDFFNSLQLSPYEISPDKINKIRTEFTLAHVLRQVSPKIELNREALNNEGIDPARVVKYLILQASYPKGIELDNENFTFSLEPKDLENLLIAIKKIPGYENLSKEDLIKKILINSLGFKTDNEEDYFLRINQERLKDLIRSIAYIQTA